LAKQQKEASEKQQVVEKLMVSMIRAVREDHKSIRLGE